MPRNSLKDEAAAINRAAMHQRYGKERSEQFVDLILGVAHKEMFGLWGYNRLGQGQQFWANPKDDLNQIRKEVKIARRNGTRFVFPTDPEGRHLFPEKLTRRKLVAHVMATGKDEYVWFSNRGFQGQDYRVMLCADIDWHKELIDQYGDDSDAEVVVEFLRDRLFPSCYWEPSTNGLGRHLYFLMTVPASVYHEELVTFLRALEAHISSLVTDAGFRAGCDEVKGQPAVYENGLIDRFGALAKVPRPGTVSDMDALLSLVPISYTSLRDLVKPLEESGDVTRREQEGRAEIVGEDGDGAALPSAHRIPSRVADLTAVTDTFRRVKAAHKTWVRLNPSGSQAEFSRWYEEMGLKIGNSDERLIAQAFEKYASLKAGSVFSLDQAFALYDSLNPSDADRCWRKTEKLTRNQVSRFWQLATTILFKVHPDSRRQFTLSSAFVTKELRISGSQYTALKRLSLKYGVLFVIDDGYIVGGKNGVSKKFGLGTAHPLRPQFEEMMAMLTEERITPHMITPATDSTAA